MIKRMFKTQTGMYFWPKGTESTNGYINTAEGEFCYLYPEAEHAATQAALAAAQKVVDVCYEGIPANFIKDLASTAQELKDALTQLRDAKGEDGGR